MRNSVRPPSLSVTVAEKLALKLDKDFRLSTTVLSVCRGDSITAAQPRPAGSTMTLLGCSCQQSADQWGTVVSADAIVVGHCTQFKRRMTLDPSLSNLFSLSIIYWWGTERFVRYLTETMDVKPFHTKLIMLCRTIRYNTVLFLGLRSFI